MLNILKVIVLTFFVIKYCCIVFLLGALVFGIFSSIIMVPTVVVKVMTADSRITISRSDILTTCGAMTSTGAAMCVFFLGWFSFYMFIADLGLGGFRTVYIQNKAPYVLRGKKTSSEDVCVYGAIYALRTRATTNPKDKLYSIYGFLSSLGAPLLKPDYAKSKGRIYQDLISDLLRWRPYLLRLMIDTGSTCPEHAASWVPDWTTVLEKTWLSQDYTYGTNKCDATPGSIAHASINGIHLKVKTNLKGLSQFCSQPLRDLDIVAIMQARPTALRSLFEQVLDIYRLVSFAGHDAETLARYESSSFVIYCVLEGEPMRVGTLKAAQFSSFYNFIRTHSVPILSEQTSASAASLFEHSSRDADAFNYLRRCCAKNAGKRNIFTCQNGSVGSGPPTMKATDQVVLVAGVPVPLILRAQDKGSRTFTLVGPAYVHGMMNGEEWGNEEMCDIALL